MGLFGSRKKNVDVDGLPAVPPRFAPEEVHTAYKEALAKDSLPSTQLPPEPQSLQQAPVQDSLAPIKLETDAPSFEQSSSPSSLDDALNDDEDFTSAPVVDPLTTVDDLPVSSPPVENTAPTQLPLTSPAPATTVQEETFNPSASLAPEGEIPEAPSPEPNNLEPNTPDVSQVNTPAPVTPPFTVDSAPLEEKVSSFQEQKDVSASLADAPSSQSNYVSQSSSSVTYKSKSSPDLPEEFPTPSEFAADELSPIAPEESFDEDELPEIGVAVDEYTSNMAAKPVSSFKNFSSESSSSMPFDLEPPVKPTDLPSTMPNDDPDDSIAPELAPLDTSTTMYNQSENTVVASPSSPAPSSNKFSVSQDASPVEERVILKHAVGTDVFVEKYVYEDALLEASAVQKDLQNAGSHLDKVLRDEIAVTKKIDDWNTILNIIQEKLMTIDMRLFEKGDV